MERNNEPKTYTDKRGKFAPGNPGRPKGARHKTTRAIEDLLEGEAEGLTRKAIDMALEGDTTALRLCLERLAPARRDVTVEFDLPHIESAQEAAQAARAVLQAVSDGRMTPSEAATVMALVESFRKTLEMTEIEQRIAALEARQ